MNSSHHHIIYRILLYDVIHRAVLWPAAWAVSNYLLSEPDLRDNLSSLSILELGTGTGLVSIAAAMGGAKRVLATDYEPLALELTRYAADNINGNSNNSSNNNNVPLSKIIETRLLDLCALQEQPLPITDIDVVIASDIMYEPKTGIAMAHRAVEALRQNCRVIVGDSPGRVRNNASKAFAVVLRPLSSCGMNLLCTFLFLMNCCSLLFI
jgi:predicted nicotinamide N-methyase